MSFQPDVMNTRELFRQVLYTVLSFLYINGDSEFGLNNDGFGLNTDRDYDSIGLPPQNNLFNKAGSQKSLSNFGGQRWPYWSGSGQNTNVVIPPMVPTVGLSGMKGSSTSGVGPPVVTPGVEGIINKSKGTPILGTGPPVGGPIIDGIEGIINKSKGTPILGTGPPVGGPIIDGIINKSEGRGEGLVAVSGIMKGLPAPRITSSAKGVVTGQKFNLSTWHQWSRQAQFSGAWKGGAWKGLAPRQTGAVPLPGGQPPIPQIPTYGYKGRVPFPQIPSTKPGPTPSISSLPIPGILPGPLKQPGVPTEPIHGLPLNFLYGSIPMVPAVTGEVGGALSGEFMLYVSISKRCIDIFIMIMRIIYVLISVS